MGAPLDGYRDGDRLHWLYQEFVDDTLEAAFRRDGQRRVVRRIRYAALVLLGVIVPVWLVDYVSLGPSNAFALLSVSRGVEALLALWLIQLASRRRSPRVIGVACWAFFLAVLIQTVLQAWLYPGNLAEVLIQQMLLIVFGLIFFPGSLRLLLPLIVTFVAVVLAQLHVVAPLPSAEATQLTFWVLVVLAIGLFTAQQLRRAERQSFVEIRRRDRIMEQLEEARLVAESASRAKSEFLANMSHELRTPLNAIIGFSEMMSHGVFGSLDNERYDEYVRDIATSGRHLLSLIDDVLDLAKIEAGRQQLRLDTVDLHQVATEAVRLVAQQAAAAGLTVLMRGTGGAVVRADERAMRQVLLNLLSNAIKFTPRGGEIVIAIGRLAEGSMQLSVRDTGIGIPEDEQERVLQPFEQISGDNSYPRRGWGLGLSIVRALVSMHGARLDVDSVPGAGTTVSIIFPPSAVSDAGPEASPRPASSGGS